MSYFINIIVLSVLPKGYSISKTYYAEKNLIILTIKGRRYKSSVGSFMVKIKKSYGVDEIKDVVADDLKHFRQARRAKKRCQIPLLDDGSLAPENRIGLRVHHCLRVLNKGVCKLHGEMNEKLL